MKTERNLFDWKISNKNRKLCEIKLFTLLNVLRFYVNIFNFLWYDVFALTQLENVLFAIDYLEGSIW